MQKIKKINDKVRYRSKEYFGKSNTEIKLADNLYEEQSLEFLFTIYLRN